MKRAGLGFLLWWLLCSQAAAGGIAWPFRVMDIQVRDGGFFSVRLAPVEKHGEFPGACEILEVNGSHASLRWFFFGAGYMTKENTSAALAYLKQAHIEGRVVQFGEMGNGLRLEKDAPCKGLSRGLALMSDSNEPMVLSYYKWP